MTDYISIVMSGLAIMLSGVALVVTYARGRKPKGWPYAVDDGKVGTFTGITSSGAISILTTPPDPVAKLAAKELPKPASKPKSKTRATGPRPKR
jgi:hypothetical protein